MKPKLITLCAAILAFLSVSAVFICCKSKPKPGKDEVKQFILSFNRKVKAGKISAVMACFEGKQDKGTIAQLVKILQGKAGLREGEEALFDLSVDGTHPDISIINDEEAQAVVTVKFTCDKVANTKTSLTFKIHKLDNHKLKIAELNVDAFLKEYYAYEQLVRQKTYTDAEIYSPITLRAFETAKQLKGTYDSVAYFTHLNEKTWYYVGKNKTQSEKEASPADSSLGLKMGLLNPELKEIIPPLYDQVYNINGTFNGLIEVEKSARRGFYNLAGKVVVPVEFDQIFPVNDPQNLAVLRKNDDYFYFKNDSTISEKVNLKAADFIKKIKLFGNSYIIDTLSMKGITEYNSREEHRAVYFCPSYLADLNMVSRSEMDFKNPLRHHIDYNFEDIKYDAKIVGRTTSAKNNWIEAAFYYVKDHFVGDRTDIYNAKKIVVADLKRNRVLGMEMAADYSGERMGDQMLSGLCNENSIKMINDSLYEVKTSSVLSFNLYNDQFVGGGPYYHYLAIKNGKLIELPDKRNFNFTRYIKMDDTYLNGCYELNKKPVGHVSDEMLRYIKNEIFASYNYKFKDPKWAKVFYFSNYMGNIPESANANPNVDDSLTSIDKYNINWIMNKLKKKSTNTIASK